MALLIKADGTRYEVEPRNGSDFKQRQLRTYVHGPIEILHLGNGEIMVLNEEGKFTEERNEQATRMAEEHRAVFFGEYIAGDVLVCKEEEIL